ncbi:hypothetical protein D3C71_1278070 [compost metagenome]
MQDRGGTLDAKRQRDADDDLVEAEPHAEDRHQRRDQHAAAGAADEAEQRRISLPGNEEAGIGPGQHHAFDADIQHAGLFRQLFAETGQKKRNARGDGAGKQRGQKGCSKQGHDQILRPSRRFSSSISEIPSRVSRIAMVTRVK